MDLTFLKDRIDHGITDIREYNEREFRRLNDSIDSIRDRQLELYKHICDREFKLSHRIWEIESKLSSLIYYGIYALGVIMTFLIIIIALI